MSVAPYEVNVTGTDDETFAFITPFENTDGTAFPFAEYVIEYVVTQSGSPVLTLTQGNGIAIDGANVTFKAPRGSLKPGEYEHGCRIRNIMTGDEIQVFAGAVVIGEGQFGGAAVSAGAPADPPGSGTTTLTAFIKSTSDPLYAPKDATSTAISDLNTSLASKADAASVNTALASKADTSSVNTALSAKADTSTVDTALANKADKTSLTAKQDGTVSINGTTKPVIEWLKELVDYKNAQAGTGTGTGGTVTLATPNLIVSTTGNDTTGNGTLATPYLTVEKAVAVATPGTTIYARGGLYTLAGPNGIQLNKSGTETSRYTLQSYPGEKAIIDGSNLSAPAGSGNWPGSGTAGGCCINLWNASYWTIQDLEIRNSGMSNINIDGSSSNNILRRLVVHHAGTAGRYGGSGVTCYASGPNNLWEDIDSYSNTGASPSDSDGFQTCPKTGGTGWILRRCRSWFNGDDGFDAFQVTSGQAQPVVTYDGCWAYRNGSTPDGSGWSTGDGQGFKMGGRRASDTTGTSGNHVYNNCLSWGNKASGFDENSGNGGTGTITLYNCTSYNNVRGTSGYYNFGLYTSKAHILRNCVSYGLGGLNINASASHDHNSWDSSITLANSDFKSLTDTGMTGARGTNGSLPVLDFLRPSASSKLIGAGVNVGLPFSGSAPDMGAFQS